MTDREAERARSTGTDGPPPALTPDHGIGRWITQGAIISLSAWVTFAAAELLARVFWAVPFGIAAAPVTAGIYLMALRRFRGRRVGFGDLLDARRFALQAMLVGLSVNLVPYVLFYVGTRAGPDPIAGGEDWRIWYTAVAALYVLTRGLIGAAAFYAMPLVVDQGMGGWEAVKRSWTVTRGNYWSYLGMEGVLLLLSQSGGLLLGVGTLITGPMAQCAKASAYMYHFERSASATESGAR